MDRHYDLCTKCGSRKRKTSRFCSRCASLLPNLGAFKKGETSAFKGKTHSNNAKLKMSAKRKGRKLSTEWRRKLGDSLAGEKSYNWKGGKYFFLSKRFRSQYPPKGDRCEICLTFEQDLKHSLCFDHDHKTGKFRGWICKPCNFALGFVKDNIQVLDSMKEYLEKANH